MNTYALIFWIDEAAEAAVMEVGTLIQCRNQLRNMVEWWYWLYNAIEHEPSDEDVWEKWDTSVSNEGKGFRICGENWRIIHGKEFPQYYQVGDTVPIPKED